MDINDAIINEQFPFFFYMYPDKRGIQLKLRGDYLGEFQFKLLDRNRTLKGEGNVNKIKKDWFGFIPISDLLLGTYHLRLFRGRIMEARDILIQVDQ